MLMPNQQFYQYPTPVNVISGGSYNPGQYDTYPDRNSDYYRKMKQIYVLKINISYFFSKSQRHASTVE